jgi:hypothetical protein
MALSIQLNYNFTTCKIIATISDSLNRGKDGVVQIHVSGPASNLQAPFQNLNAQPRTISFNAPKTGLVHRFDGTVDIDEDFGFHTIFSQTCPSIPLPDEPA